MSENTNDFPGPDALWSWRRDRAVGVVVASAAGDALGSQYEFGPALDDNHPPEFGVSPFGHAPGEWTDDTSMAVPILQALARGDSLNDSDTLARIVAEWRGWAESAKDVGVQTSAVLRSLPPDCTESRARDASRAVHERTGRSGGNGSLMRTGPVALGYLGDGEEAALADAAGRLAQLTHWEDDNVDACVLWSLAVRHAVRTGELDVARGLEWVPAGRRDRWAGLIAEAMRISRKPKDFAESNGWVVRAFQCALSAVRRGPFERRVYGSWVSQVIWLAIRAGGDTDTVAAIAGSLAGALGGGSQVSASWRRKLHGWPGLNANDLADLAFLALNGGRPAKDGWPTAGRVATDGFLHTAPVRHPLDDGVWLGSLSALDELPGSIGAVVSLSRVGSAQVPPGVESVRVWLIDNPGHNMFLDLMLFDTANVIAELRAEGKEVFVHCAEARSRTAAVAAMYGVLHCGVSHDRAWGDVEATLPHFDPAPFLREAVDRITS